MTTEIIAETEKHVFSDCVLKIIDEFEYMRLAKMFGEKKQVANAVERIGLELKFMKLERDFQSLNF